MNTLRNSFQKLTLYPSAIAGLFVVFLLVVMAVYTMIAIPYPEAIRLWRGGEDVWYRNPRFAAPAWFNYFSSKKYSESFAVNTTDGSMIKNTIPGEDGVTTFDISYEFDFQYDVFPQEMLLYLTSTSETKQPFVSIELLTPDNRTIRISNFAIGDEFTYRFSQDEKLLAKLRAADVIPALFTMPDGEEPLKGKYKLLITGTTFEPGSDINVELVSHGQVFGLAGTDHARRDLTLPLLWGTPVALAFGLIASVGTSILTMIIAAVGAWYAGWVDELIQRITEVNLVLPFFAILIMIGTFYSRSIWVILGATILLSIFTGAIKGYRAVFLQVKESMYIEAARAYGASNSRIIFLYLIPRMIPLLIPSLVNPPTGCRFHPRCAKAIAGLCDEKFPPDFEPEPNHFVACWLYQ